MVTLELTKTELIVHVAGLDKLWAFKSTLAIPLEHVAGAEVGVSEAARDALAGSIRVGTHLGGVITAGRFYREGKIAFWDVHRGDQAITIHVAHDDYTHLVVEVADPAAAVADVLRATAARPR